MILVGTFLYCNYSYVILTLRPLKFYSLLQFELAGAETWEYRNFIQ